MRDGYRAIKLHETTVEAVAAARASTGPNVALTMDTNCPWNVEEALGVARAVQPYGLTWLEEPIWPPEDYIALAKVMWSPIHAKLKLGGGIVHADVLLYAGGGRMIHDAVQGIAYDAGAALDMFVTRALTVRLSLQDLMAVQEIAAETHFTNNLIATAGIALWIPSGL